VIDEWIDGAWLERVAESSRVTSFGICKETDMLLSLDRNGWPHGWLEFSEAGLSGRHC